MSVIIDIQPFRLYDFGLSLHRVTIPSSASTSALLFFYLPLFILPEMLYFIPTLSPPPVIDSFLFPLRYDNFGLQFCCCFIFSNTISFSHLRSPSSAPLIFIKRRPVLPAYHSATLNPHPLHQDCTSRHAL